MRVSRLWLVACAGLGASTGCLPDAPPRPGFTDSSGADDSTVDGDSDDSDSDDSDSDDSDSDDSGTLDPTSREINLYEPCEELSPGVDDGCTPGGPAYADLGSTWRRTDEPTEIALVVEGVSEWNTPGVQPDFDDVRVVVEGDLVPHEIVGARLHSDTPCSMASDDGTWSHREDLCGVEAWWPLQGDGVEVISGTGAGLGNGLSKGAGLYGQEAGSVAFAGGSSHLKLEDSASIQLPQAGTWELWFRRPGGCPDGQEYLLSKNHSGAHVDGLLWLEPSCEVRFFRESGIEFTSSPLDVTAWHHVAITWDSDTFWVYIDGLPVLETGQGGGIVSDGNPLFVGATGADDGVTASYGFTGLLADVLVHSVTKSPDYVYRRARPRFPVVRFLADTEENANAEGHYPFQATTLDWGDESATWPAPLVLDPDSGETCYGLLSPCNGYVGWWRFEEGYGDLARDDSTLHNHATLSGTTWSTGPSGGTLCQSPGATAVVPAHPSLDLPNFTLDALFRVDNGFAESLTLFLKVQSGPHDNYMVVLEMNGELKLIFEYPSESGGIGDARSLAGQTVTEGVWTQAGGSFNGAQVQSHVNHHWGQALPQTIEPYQTPLPVYLAGSSSHGSLCVDSMRILNRGVPQDAQLHHPLSQFELGPVRSTP